MPPWLHELRDLLTLADDETRAAAMRTWEERWLVTLQARKVLHPAEDEDSTVRLRRLLDAMRRDMRSMLVNELANVMVRITDTQSAVESWTGRPLIEVRGEVTAIRAEPKDGPQNNA